MMSIQGGAGQELRSLHAVERQARKLHQSLERLSTGKRINRAADDPAGMVAATEVRGDINELEADLKSLRLGRQDEAVADTVQGAIAQALHFLRGQIVTAASDTTTDEQRAALQQEVDNVIEAIDRVATKHPESFNALTLEALRSGQAANLVDGDRLGAEAIVDSALDGLNHNRVGNAANARASDAYEQLYEDLIVTHTETLSLIEDTDFAVETASFVQSRTLLDASYASLTFERQQRVSIATKLVDQIGH